MWQNRDLGLDAGLNSPEKTGQLSIVGIAVTLNYTFRCAVFQTEDNSLDGVKLTNICWSNNVGRPKLNHLTSQQCGNLCDQHENSKFLL